MGWKQEDYLINATLPSGCGQSRHHVDMVSEMTMCSCDSTLSVCPGAAKSPVALSISTDCLSASRAAGMVPLMKYSKRVAQPLSSPSGFGGKSPETVHTCAPTTPSGCLGQTSDVFCRTFLMILFQMGAAPVM